MESPTPNRDAVERMLAELESKTPKTLDARRRLALALAAGRPMILHIADCDDREGDTAEAITEVVALMANTLKTIAARVVGHERQDETLPVALSLVNALTVQVLDGGLNPVAAKAYAEQRHPSGHA